MTFEALRSSLRTMILFIKLDEASSCGLLAAGYSCLVSAYKK
jgi:hypothetical protein